MQWYYLLNGERQGPVDDAGLDALVRQGTVKDDTLVWRDGLSEWHPYGAVKPKPPAPAPAPPRPEPPRPEPAPVRAEPVTPRQEMPRPEPAPPRPEPSEPRPQAYAPPMPAPAAAGGSHRAFFFYPVLEALNDGRVIRKIVIICLKVGAVLIALGGLLMALTVLTAGLKGSGGSALGGILFALILLVTAACVAQIYWYRAGSVSKLAYSPRNTVIAVFAILSRTGGEAAATGFSGLGIGACLFLWLASDVPLSFLPAVPYLGQAETGGFLGGLFILIYLVLLGFGALILGYMWSEWIMLMVDIERNTRGDRS